MHALTFNAPGDVEYTEVADPAIIDPTDVIVRVESTAICGSDLHVYRGQETGLDQGTILGHEFLGEVVAVGSAVAHFRQGQRVVSAFSTSCGECFYCERHLTARCERGELFGWIAGGCGLNGGQAEYVRVPLADTTLGAVPMQLAETPAALFVGDILSTGLFCAENGGVGPGSTVAVLGCGPVGLMSIAAAHHLGAERIWAVDGVPERLSLAAAFGAEPLDLSSAPLEIIREATAGRGVDIVLEAVGSPAATRLACDLLRPGGTISAAGVHTEAIFAFSPVEAYDKNLTYRAGRCSARTYMRRAITMAVSGAYPLDSIVSHRMPLAQGALGYDIFDRRVDGCTKVILRPNG